MSNSHFDLPVQFTHTKDQQNLVSSASSLLFFVFISLFVSVFPGFILTKVTNNHGDTKHLVIPIIVITKAFIMVVKSLADLDFGVYTI